MAPPANSLPILNKYSKPLDHYRDDSDSDFELEILEDSLQKVYIADKWRKVSQGMSSLSLSIFPKLS